MELAAAAPSRSAATVCAVAVQLDRDYIRALREAGTPMPKIGRTVTIDTGKNAGNHPSVASGTEPSPRQRPSLTWR